MSDLHKEQHPLLCDECSDEELQIQNTGPKFHRRFRHSATTGRARTHAIGAAAIITSWPDNVSSLLAYWWIGLGMIAVMVFLLYNSFLAIAVLPRPHNYLPISSNPKYITSNKSDENPAIPIVYMHVFVANYDEFNSDNYIPYVQAIAKKYTNFKYNFFVVLNDVSKDALNDLSDEQKNEMALNSLWDNTKVVNKKLLYTGPSVKFISLTKYMDDSPLKKYWRLLPYQFIGFLMRCISIWDKGGVAFNPLILTPNSPNSVYLEKLHTVLANIQTKSKISKRYKVAKQPKKQLNNIREIIEDLENEDRNDSIFTESLSEAENSQTVTVSALKPKRNAKLLLFDQRHSAEKQNDENFMKTNNVKKDLKKVSINLNKPKQTVSNDSTDNAIPTEQNIFPKFLDFLFHLNSKNYTSIHQRLKNETSNINSPNNNHYNEISNDTSKAILAGHELNIKTRKISLTSNGNVTMKLILDLKGNLIATNTACHAFIGTVFSNVLHHTDEESVTDLIMKQLSLFCKGNLSTCSNVEVILL